jgi:hypothetical protein
VLHKGKDLQLPWVTRGQDWFDNGHYDYFTSRSIELFDVNPKFDLHRTILYHSLLRALNNEIEMNYA